MGSDFISNDDAFDLAQTLKGGTFQYGDGQGDITHKFANLVIERHERIRAAAPDLFEALKKIIEMNRQHAQDEFGDAEKAEDWACVVVARAALLKAGGGDA